MKFSFPLGFIVFLCAVSQTWAPPAPTEEAALPKRSGRAVLTAVPRDKHSGRTVVAEVVALNHSFNVNRLGASMPNGQIFALRSDVTMKGPDGPVDLPPYKVNEAPITAEVNLKEYKRPR